MKTCPLEEKMIELKVKETKTKYFIIGPEVSSKLDISEDDIILAKNPSNQKMIAGEVKIDQAIEEKTVLIDKILFRSIGLDEGSDIVVLPYEKDVKKPVKASFAVERKGKLDKKPLKLVKENEEGFIDFISSHIWTRDSKFLWEDKELLVSLDNTNRKIEKGDAVDLNGSDKFRCSLVDSESYSCVLLIDLSGSMETRDLVLEEIDQKIEKIRGAIESTTEFLEKLEEGSKIKRSEAAVLCTLIYLVQEIEKASTDKIAVIPFSDGSSVIEFDGGKYFSVEDSEIENAFEEIIEEITYHPRGRTNISAGLNEAIEIMKDFKNDKMKMVVLLTDGEPYPPSIDSKEEVMDLVDNRLAPRKDVIVNTIGVGDEVDHHHLDKIAKETDGEYTYIRSLKGLTDAYSRYAESISIDWLDTQYIYINGR